MVNVVNAKRNLSLCDDLGQFGVKDFNSNNVSAQTRT